MVTTCLAVTVMLTGCAAANERNLPEAPAGQLQLSGTLVGAGSSAQQAAMQAWSAGFTAVQPDAQVIYDPVGSGAGRDQFLTSAVDFAGSDAYLSDAELAEARERCAGQGGALDLPVYISPIAIAYHLPGVKDLRLSPATVAGIFNQEITRWDDPAIAADNPGVDLPSTRITPVNRSDESGTTENFTDYLAQAAGEAWPYEASDVWPVPGGEAAQGNSGVVAAVRAGEGTIGYADASQVGDLDVAEVKVGDEYVGPSPDAAAAVLDASEVVAGRPEHDLAFELDRATTASGAYPVVLVSYQVVCSTYEDAETADLVKGFLEYVISPEGQQTAAEFAGSAPISADLRQRIEASIGTIEVAQA